MASKRMQSQILFLSLALNLSLIATLIFVAVKEKEITLAKAPDPVPFDAPLPLTNGNLIHDLLNSSYHQLLTFLTDSELVEEGYTKRDLALGCLVSFYHFHLERALGNTPLQKRTLLLNHPQKKEKLTFYLYPGLTDCHYQAILHFLKVEKWPFTPLGLFHLIKHSEPFPDSTLIEAFAHTSEFRSLSTLFSKSGMEIDQTALIHLLTQGDWEIINNFTTQQRLLPDLTEKRRRALVLQYLEVRSSLAARIFIEADAEFAAKRLSDDHILLLFDLYPESTPHLKTFAKTLLSSPRSDAVWKKAATKLDLHITPVSQQINEKKIYTVEVGDSLWKIARKFSTTIEQLMEHNNLDTDTLHPNTVLNIP